MAIDSADWTGASLPTGNPIGVELPLIATTLTGTVTLIAGTAGKRIQVFTVAASIVPHGFGFAGGNVVDAQVYVTFSDATGFAPGWALTLTPERPSDSMTFPGGWQLVTGASLNLAGTSAWGKVSLNCQTLYTLV